MHMQLVCVCVRVIYAGTQTEVLTLTFSPGPLPHIDVPDLHYLAECLPHSAACEVSPSLKSRVGGEGGVRRH